MRKMLIVTIGLMIVFATLMLYNHFNNDGVDFNLLAVVIVTENLDPDYDPYGYRCGSYTYGSYACMVHLYNPINHTFQAIAEGDGLRWSPSGRYLAIVRTVSPVGIQAGNVQSFTIYDMETGTTHQQQSSGASSLTWSPNERYLIVTGWASSGLNGSNSWFEVLDGNGAGTLSDYHASFPGGIMGSRGGRTPRGWTANGDLVIRDVNNVTDRNHLMLVDMETGDAHDIDEDFDAFTPFHTESTPNTYWGTAFNVISPDNQFVATASDEYEWSLWEIQTLTLIINDDAIFSRIDVTIPDNIIDVQRMAWRPLSQ